MPTKPILTATFATDAVFGSGPATGFPTKIIPPSLLQGNIPGIGVNAEAINYVHNIWGDWTSNWVFLGTFAADEDAHIVETDSDGLVSAARMDVGGSTVGGAVASITCFSPASGGGPALSVSNTVQSNERTVDIESDVTGGEPAVALITRDGTGHALEIESAGSHTGRGVQVFTLATSGAPVRLIPRADPGATLPGDIWFSDVANRERLRLDQAGSIITAWSTSEGFARAFDTERTETSTSAGGFVAKVTAVFVAGDGLVSGETVHVRATCEVGQDTTGSTLALRLRDLTAPADIIASESQLARFVSTAADERYVIMEADYVLPASGARSIALEFEATGGGAPVVFIRNASIEVTGQY